MGVGYYNTWTNLKMSSNPNRSAFTRHLKTNNCIRVPFAHGEGRFLNQRHDGGSVGCKSRVREPRVQMINGRFLGGGRRPCAPGGGVDAARFGAIGVGLESRFGAIAEEI